MQRVSFLNFLWFEVQINCDFFCQQMEIEQFLLNGNMIEFNVQKNRSNVFE